MSIVASDLTLRYVQLLFKDHNTTNLKNIGFHQAGPKNVAFINCKIWCQSSYIFNS